MPEGIIEKFKFYYRLFGYRAVPFVVLTRFRKQPTEVAITPPGIRHPVHLRLKSSDVGVYKQIFFDHEYALALRKDPAVIVDAGANVGFASVFFATTYPQAKVLAIEPEAANFALLQRNVAPYPAVVPIRAALWNGNAAIDLVDPGDGPWGFRTFHGSAPAPYPTLEKVPGMTVEAIMQNYGIAYIDILKVDIEGSEKEVFENVAPWIDRVGVVMIELHDDLKAGCSQTFDKAAQAFAFRHQRGETIFVARTEYAPERLPDPLPEPG